MRSYCCPWWSSCHVVGYMLYRVCYSLQWTGSVPQLGPSCQNWTIQTVLSIHALHDHSAVSSAGRPYWTPDGRWWRSGQSAFEMDEPTMKEAQLYELVRQLVDHINSVFGLIHFVTRLSHIVILCWWTFQSSRTSCCACSKLSIRSQGFSTLGMIRSLLRQVWPSMNGLDDHSTLL